MKKPKSRKVSAHTTQEQNRVKVARTKRRAEKLKKAVNDKVFRLGVHVANMKSELMNTRRENTALASKLEELKAKHEPERKEVE